ncbi:MAG: exodeoxyribonuclease VII large subunit [Microbacteriaceae bacterium]|nr:exodeoxyribonuclease VII large subunit [Microbacteriaceae bacterium]
MRDETAVAEDINESALPPSRNSSAEDPWPIARLSQNLKDYIARLGNLWVEGEIAQYNSKGSSVFLDIKDVAQEARISAHSWNPAVFPADLKVGDRVLALVKTEFWPKSGKLSLQVMQIRKVGLGDLLERLERLRAALIAEGLTSSERKQKLPFLPNRIGLITGEKSDAEKDVLQNVARRWPEAQFRVINTKVQGDSAAPEIIAAIKALDADPEVDVIIIARGGGAAMELLVFSDEALVRTAAAASTPIISAIGHENDSPLLDLVADVRASTPTDAAKIVVPDVAEERRRITDATGRILARVAHYIQTQSDLVAQMRLRPMLANPFGFIEEAATELSREVAALRSFISLSLERAVADIQAKAQVLRSLSPQSTLDRGYSVVRSDSGAIITDASKVKAGQKLKIRVAKGEISATSDGK